MELKSNISRIMLNRLVKIRDNNNDELGQRLTYNVYIDELMDRLSRMTGEILQKWREKIISCSITSGLQSVTESNASRRWITDRPKGWTGRDYVRALQLRSGNLPTAAIPSNPSDQRNCRAGCNKKETICHVLQDCPATHWPRIRRHNEITKKIAGHCKRMKWPTELDPHVRRADGTLFKPDLLIHKSPSTIIICGIQVCWEGDLTLQQSHDRKKATYNTSKFIELLTINILTNQLSSKL